MRIRHVFFASLLLTLMLGGCQCDDGSGGPAPDADLVDLGGPEPDAGGDEDAGEVADPCDPNPCGQEGRGVCVALESAYSCQCDPGLEEREGECVADACAGDPCAGAPDTVCDPDAPGLCVCAPGFHDEAGACVADASCGDDPCGGRGECDDAGGVISCACREGFSGDFCEACDAGAGFVPDGDGGCTDDPCDVLTCSGGKECQATDDAAVCVCPAGTHEEQGACVIDEECQPNTCSGNGACDDADGVVSCTCDEGYTGESCGGCDDAAGFHPDGAGGCTNDPCLPNPCSQPNETVCTSGAPGSPAVCSCDPGFHPDASGACVPDEACAPDSCSGNGACDDSTREVECACDPGYTGDVCGACDALAGYRDDGMGGCTDDPCLPNPCTEPNETVCTSGGPGTQPVCACDPGFHPDGAGGCTDDPCLPDLCAAQNQACRVEGGQPVCFTPDCDDANPCTDDALVAGQCEYTDVADGTGCQLDACQVGGSCQQGSCLGTAAPACDDANPCTDDYCDVAQGGCVNDDDDTNVPDDGVGCTTDSCSGGIASHAPDDGACDDGLFCTGVEVCAPQSGSADAQGCVVTDVPQAPADPGPCQSYGACDEATQGFPLSNAQAGALCDDGIACTTGDACDAAGQCAGAIDATCQGGGPTACATTTPWTSSVDVPVARVASVDVTYGGVDIMTAAPRDALYIYAHDEATNAYHRLYYYYRGSSSTTVRETVGLPPGIYDIVFTNDPDELNDPVQIFFQSTAGEVIEGYKVLEEDVVLGAGTHTISVDVPVAEVTSIDVQYGGVDILTAAPRDALYIYAHDKDTKAYHRLYYYYRGSSSTTVRETVGLPPGVYDIVFTNDPDELNDPVQIFFQSTAGEVIEGYKVLQTDVVFTAGANTVSVDVPVAEVTSIDVQYGGVDILTAAPRDALYIYAHDKATKAYHRLYYYYRGSSSTTVRETVGLPPGTYDIVFTNDPDELNDPVQLFFQSTAGEVIEGYKVLEEDVVFVDGANTISVNVPVAEVTSIDVTYGGVDILTAAPRDALYIYAHDKATKAYHRLYYYYRGSSSTTVRETVGLPPGVYDIVFTNDPDELNDPVQIFFQSTSGEVIEGYKVLEEDVVFTAGVNTVSVDVPVAEVTSIDVQYGGVDILTAAPRDALYIYAHDRATKAYHRLYYYYRGSSSTTVRETVGLPPGTYDIVFTNDPDELNDPVQIFFQSTAGEVIEGYKVLQTDVVFTAGVNTVAVDVPVAPVTSIDVSYDGLDLMTAAPRDALYIYAFDRLTRAYHRLLYYYRGSSSTTVRETVGLPPGTYDIVFTNDPDELNDPVQIFFQSTSGEVIEGFQVLDRCVAFP